MGHQCRIPDPQYVVNNLIGHSSQNIDFFPLLLGLAIVSSVDSDMFLSRLTSIAFAGSTSELGLRSTIVWSSCQHFDLKTKYLD